MIAMLSSRCHDLVCPGICPTFIMIISDILFSLVLIFISSDRSLASEMLSSRCHDSACRGIRLSLNCIPATRQTIVTTGHQPHTIPRAHIPQMHLHNTTCTYTINAQYHIHKISIESPATHVKWGECFANLHVSTKSGEDLEQQNLV